MTTAFVRAVGSPVCAGLGFLAAHAPALGAEHTLKQSGKAFAPVSVSAKGGDTILFRNDDTVAHNVFSSFKGNEFNLKIQKPGESASVDMKKEGTFEIRCVIHPKMILQVSVQK